VQQQGLELVQRDVPVGQPAGEAGGVERQRPRPGDQRPERGVGAVERAEPVPVRAGPVRTRPLSRRARRGTAVSDHALVHPDQDRQILAKTLDCLPSGGLVVISELLVNDDKTGPPPAALMSLTMLIEDEGRNYTAAEYEQWLTETGFHNARSLALDVPGANGLIIAEKP
jgi:hypothetical protein